MFSDHNEIKLEINNTYLADIFLMNIRLSLQLSIFSARDKI